MSRIPRAFAFPWLRENRPVYLLILGSIFAIPLGVLVFLSAVTGKADLIGLLIMVEVLVVALAMLVFASAYGWMGRRVARAREKCQFDAPDLETPCLIVRGMIQAPGTALLKDGRLWLVPAVGKPVDLDLATVQTEERAKWFNGSLYPGQSGFWFKGPGVSRRLGFMPDSADAWRAALRPVEGLGAKH